MPWKVETVNETRREFGRRIEAKEKSMAALCREYGISRPTGYKWLKRYQTGEAMNDRSRKPFHTANRISAEAEEKIVAARKAEPAVGALKTRRMLMNDHWVDPPSVSTINAVFRRNGLITKEASQKTMPYRRFEKETPNEMWQADFKGDFLMRDGVRCYPLSIIDDCSRFCLCGDARSNMQLLSTKESFEQVFQTYGLPKILLCDNGSPWGNSQTTSFTHFEVWLMELSVLPIHIRPKHPQTQGKVEKFNGSYKQERLKFYLPKNMADAQRCREEYQLFYNYRRPHHALGLDVPANRYLLSSRLYPQRIEEWYYESDCELRMVKSSGYINYCGQGFYLSEGLGDKQVALRPSGKEGIWDIVFRQFRVGRLDLENHTITSRRIYLLQDDPRANV